MNGMIGYNIKSINDLMEAIKTSYKLIETAMSTPWQELSTTMRREWKGPDEYANENSLANHLDSLYQACSEAVQGVSNNIFGIGEAWRSFQGKNTLKDGVAATLDTIGDLAAVQIQTGTLKIFKAGEKFADTENLGLVNGLTSAQTLTQAIDAYAETVYKAVDKLYQDLDEKVKSSFVGEGQDTKVIQYLHKMGSEIGKLTVCFKNVKDAIAEAAKGYQSQATTTSEVISSVESDIDTSQTLAGSTNAN